MEEKNKIQNDLNEINKLQGEKKKMINYYDNMINSRTKEVDHLKQYLNSIENDLKDKLEQYKNFNEQLNKEIFIKNKNEKENNKTSQIQEMNENLIKESQIDKDKNEIISDSEINLKENNDKIKNGSNEKNNEETIAELKNELKIKNQEINKLQEENKKSKENILKCILKEEYDKKLNELTDNEIINKISENINNKIKNLEGKYEEEYKIKIKEIIDKTNNILLTSTPENLPRAPGIRTSLQNQNVLLNNNNDNIQDYLYSNSIEDNNNVKPIYSYKCINKDKLISNIKEETDETEIKIELKNNGTLTWNEDTKLKMVEPSDIKIDDIILKQQNPEEVNTYTISFKKLKNLQAKEYQTCLGFYSEGKNFGDKIVIKINILNETEFNELEEK